MTPVDPIRKSLAPCSHKITAAFIYGSTAKGTDTAQSDIDLMIVGDGLDYSELYSALQEVESRLRRKIDPIFLSARDWRRKAAEKNSLVAKINASPKMFIIGSEKDL